MIIRKEENNNIDRGNLFLAGEANEVRSFNSLESGGQTDGIDIFGMVQLNIDGGWTNEQLMSHVNLMKAKVYEDEITGNPMSA